MDLIELYQKAIEQRNTRLGSHPDSSTIFQGEQIFSPDVFILPRCLFNESKGKELAKELLKASNSLAEGSGQTLGNKNSSIYRTISSKYVALSALNAIDSFLVKNYGLGILEKC